MKNITFAGRLQDYAGKAIDSFYKTADKIASPILDTIANVDFAGSYFNNSSISEYRKFEAMRRNFLRDESAIAQIGGEFPAPGKKMELGRKDFWKIAAAVGVLSAAGAGYAYMKKKDIGFDDIDSGIAYAKHEIFGSILFSSMNEPPVADLKIDTPQKDWISGNNIAFNASGSSDDKGIVKYEWRVDGETFVTEKPVLEQSFSEGNHLVDLTVYDKEGKSAQFGVGVDVKRPYDYYDEEFKVGIWFEDINKQNIIKLFQDFKQVTPDDYADLIKYAPKKIIKSPDRFNKYGGVLDDDIIQLSGINEERSGSDDIKTRLESVIDLVAELGNAKNSKTGVKFNNTYENEMNVNMRAVKYAVKVGVWTQEQADNYMKNISEQLKSGEYFNGLKN